VLSQRVWKNHRKEKKTKAMIDGIQNLAKYLGIFQERKKN
jgi:hypothetical protein